MKRVLDIVLSSFALVALSPILLVLAIMIRMRLGSPIFFKQVRPGLHGNPFQMVKFRTMSDEKDADGTLLPDEDRLPRFGRILRATSLDELPELWNVLRGDMSLVGPRPLLMEYMDLYSPEQARRHEVRPGITGWAQVNGRNALSWEDKFSLDVWYVDNWSILLDLKIVICTITTIIGGDGITQDGRATTDYFKGNNE